MRFSSASLDNVSSVSVFYDEKTRYCWGMLFEYENGGLRSVGQCRLHVDANKTYTKPSKLCFRTGIHSVPDGVIVEFGNNQSRHEHVVDKGWQCQSLNGTLIFWFSSRRSLLFVDQT